jgi:hypothetical protein
LPLSLFLLLSPQGFESVGNGDSDFFFGISIIFFSRRTLLHIRTRVQILIRGYSASYIACLKGFSASPCLKQGSAIALLSLEREQQHNYTSLKQPDFLKIPKELHYWYFGKFKAIIDYTSIAVLPLR